MTLVIKEQQTPTFFLSDSDLNSKYTFDNFIKGMKIVDSVLPL